MRHESPSYTLGRYTGYAPNTVMGIGEGASTTSVPPSKIVVLSISRGRQRSIACSSTARGRRQMVRPKLPKLLARQAPAKCTPIAYRARAAWPPDADNRRRRRMSHAMQNHRSSEPEGRHGKDRHHLELGDSPSRRTAAPSSRSSRAGRPPTWRPDPSRRTRASATAAPRKRYLKISTSSSKSRLLPNQRDGQRRGPVVREAGRGGIPLEDARRQGRQRADNRLRAFRHPLHRGSLRKRSRCGLGTGLDKTRASPSGTGPCKTRRFLNLRL